jgi:RHS repeat-associated protein
MAYDPITKEVASVLQSNRSTDLAYDARGRLASRTNALDESTIFGWDDAGRMTSTTRPDLATTSFAYDDGGLLTALTPPARPAHEMAHDGAGLLISYAPPTIADAEAGSTLYAHDRDRLLTREQRPGARTIDYQRSEASGRLEAMIGPSWGAGAESITIGHDTAGRINDRRGPWWQSGVPAQTLAASHAGPLLTSETFAGAADGTVSWTFDDHHRPATESIDGTSTIAFSYDEDDLLTGSGGLVIAREAATGRIATITHTHGGHTIVEERTYDAHGDLATIETRWDATLLYAVDHQRDDLGRIAEKTETVLGTTKVHAYSYDLAGRLTDVDIDGNASEHYEYDDNGNRTLATRGGVTVTATFDDQDRIVSHGGDSFDMSPNGELESRAGDSPDLDLVYDVFGNLRLATVDATELEHVADARSRRVSTKVGGTTRASWLWRSTLQPAAQLDPAGALVQRYVYVEGANVPDAVIAGADRWHLVKDHLGSVRLVVDLATGTVLRRLDFDAFGRVVGATGDEELVPFGFAGGMADAETGLVRFGARDYDPETGRWTAKDPLRFKGDGPNLYAYVENDPVNEIDPTGTHKFDKWFGYGGKQYRKFKKWVHDLKRKRELDGDVGSKEEMDDLFDEWDKAGRPDPDAKWYDDIIECLMPPFIIGDMCSVDLRFCQPGEADLSL